MQMSLIVISIILTSVLGSVLVIYGRRMNRKARIFWLCNISFFFSRHFLAFMENQSRIRNFWIFDYDFFRFANYSLSIVTAIYFIVYIHKRYSKEQNEIDLHNAENY
mgnify:FL=1